MTPKPAAHPSWMALHVCISAVEHHACSCESHNMQLALSGAAYRHAWKCAMAWLMGDTLMDEMSVSAALYWTFGSPRELDRQVL